jgi:HAD superfamily hydrolase (TIGR01509 family)
MIISYNNNYQKSYQTSNKQNLHFNALKAMVFDMDGTMVNSMDSHFEAWLRLCLQYKPINLDLDYEKGLCPENIKKVTNAYQGGSSEEFIKQLFGDIPDNLIKHLEQERNNIFCQHLEDITEIEGLTRFLDATKTIPKAVATSSSFVIVDKILAKFGINKYFNSVIDPSKVKNGKPAPDSFLKAAEVLEVSPEECLAFEDSKGGIRSAQKAGMQVVGISSGLSMEDLLKLRVKMAISDYTKISLPELKKLFD